MQGTRVTPFKNSMWRLISHVRPQFAVPPNRSPLAAHRSSLLNALTVALGLLMAGPVSPLYAPTGDALYSAAQRCMKYAYFLRDDVQTWPVRRSTHSLTALKAIG